MENVLTYHLQIATETNASRFLPICLQLSTGFVLMRSEPLQHYGNRDLENV